MFLHPQTHEEYALARTERKTAAGYHGFQFFYAPDVTLEEDLGAPRSHHQRDGARSASRWRTDRAGHRSVRRSARSRGEAFPPRQRRVLEDPVRILRIARFAARFADFSVAPETLALMTQMVGRRRSGCARRRTRVAGGVARSDGEKAVAHVRRAARLRRWRAFCRKSTRYSACRSAPTITRRSTRACT